MMTELQQQIELAEAAAALVNNLEAAKAQADALPTLRRQLATQQWVVRAEPTAMAAESEAGRILANVAPKMVEWRERLKALYSEIHAHVEALPTIQAEISLAARHARQAATLRQQIAQHTAPPAVDIDLPPDLGQLGFDEVWNAVGGYNPDLQPLPTDGYQRYEALLRWASVKPIVLYNPKMMGR